jgi:hypothetical protein
MIMRIEGYLPLLHRLDRACGAGPEDQGSLSLLEQVLRGWFSTCHEQ